MDTSYFEEQPKNLEDVVRKNLVKGEDSGSEKSSTDIIDSGSGPDYQIYIQFGWAPW
jgi:hypothetical protein